MSIRDFSYGNGTYDASLINGYFNSRADDGELISVTRSKTICCALGMLSLSDETPLEHIQESIAYLKKENNTPANRMQRNGRERAYMVATLPTEKVLEENLKATGFEFIYSIHRRNYAPENEMLNLWIISW